MNRCFRFLGLSIVLALVAAGATSVFAQTAVAQDPLVQVLVSKGILTGDEAKTLTGTPAEQRDRLIQLLEKKGVLSASEATSVTAPATTPQVKSVATSSAPALVPTVLTTAVPTTQTEKKETKPPAPTFIPAAAPIRVLQLEPAKVGGLVPAIKLGKVAVTPYGFFKASIVYDTSSPGGNDFPLPGFLGDTGPDGSPEFHLKARAFRAGANFEWPDASPKLAITGKIEFDFEGNFTRVNNRNISSIRSSQPSLRLAYGRLDYHVSDETSLFALIGQDWTPFGSSILPNSLETTGLGIGFGSIYTRAPQARVGLSHNFGGDRKFTFGPEFAITLPGFGDTPPFIGGQSVTCTVNPITGDCTSVSLTTGPGNLGDQLGYAERQGPDSQKPEVQGRLVFQWQLDKAKGVPPAQIIFSGMHATRRAIVTAAGVPAAYKAAFPTGATTESSRYGWTAGMQLPTRYVTLVANYYRGTGLRWYFAGQIYPEFTNPIGLTATATGTSIDSAGPPVIFGLLNGVPTLAPQLEPRAQGGFVELEIPLSRVFNAEPTSRAAGWSMNLHYGQDQVFARDVRRAAPGGGRGRGDWAFANLLYKINPYVTFGYEWSYYRTKAVAGTTGGLPLYKGVPSNTWHDMRSELATIFTF